MKRLSRILIFLFLLMSCQRMIQFGNASLEPLEIKVNQEYYLGSIPDQNAKKEIIIIMERLVKGVIDKNLDVILLYVEPNKGLYLDIKGLWTLEELKYELTQKNSYFHRFFYESSLVLKRKSVREILLLSGGLKLDLYFEDQDTCEVKITFVRNNHLAGDLNNPYFIHVKGKWYIYRMF